MRGKKNIVVWLTAGAVVIGGWSIAAIARRFQVVDPQVRLERPGGEDTQAAINRLGLQAVSKAMNGEVAATAARVRDACAVTLAASLLGMKERGLAEATVVRRLQETGLLPPGLTPTGQRNVLGTVYGSLLVRVQLNPLKVEVVSLPNDKKFGPGLLVRMAPDLPDGAGAQVWSSKVLERIVLPGAFISELELYGLGWREESLPALNRDGSPQVRTIPTAAKREDGERR
ncbi:MAG TPA: hypothetical protein VJ302_36905 [Blastocatellia bacterium]|nr:hypothetical protein [Blastocatellia bacterium]